MSINNGYLEKDLVSLEDVFSKGPYLAEYPRPQFKRDSYLSLNGAWDIVISQKDVLPLSYPEKVNVPFALESPLSGVNHLVEPDEILFYHKIVSLEEDFIKDSDTLLLHFEGVDQEAEVYIDNNKVGEHIGGYTPFTIELSSSLPSQFSLVVKVKDKTDSSYHQRGKQVLNPSGWFYSSSSGIYKPVWIEAVKKGYLKSVKFTPDYNKKSIKVKVESDSSSPVHMSLEGREVLLESDVEKEIPLLSFHPWSTEDPYLYPVTLSNDVDQVETYFGMRKMEIREVDGFKRLYFNDKPLFLTGLLDQGYYFLGNLTPQSYEDYKFDILKSKEAGFNFLRIHVKSELPMFYYYADKLGILLLQDFPCGGEPYDFVSVVKPRFHYFSEKDIPLKKVGRENPDGQKEFESEVKEYLSLTYNNPSVIAYTIFNEGWGEFRPSYFYDLCKSIDPTRLYDSSSGWYEADKSDFFSIHTYSIPDMKRKNRYQRCFALTEIGGVGYKVEDHTYFPKFYGHGKVKSQEELEKKVKDLYEKKVLPQIKEYGLSMVVYTQLGDCETELNGLFTFDRKVEKINPALFKKLNEELQDEYQKLFR